MATTTPTTTTTSTSQPNAAAVGGARAAAAATISGANNNSSNANHNTISSNNSTSNTTSIINIKKYIGSAPKPELWDVCSNKTLDSMIEQYCAGDLDVAIEQLQQTLVRAKELNPIRDRTNVTSALSARGRKSKAEHAIMYYEYLLEQLQRKRIEENATAGGRTKNRNKKNSKNKKRKARHILLDEDDLVLLRSSSNNNNNHNNNNNKRGRYEEEQHDGNLHHRPNDGNSSRGNDHNPYCYVCLAPTSSTSSTGSTIVENSSSIHTNNTNSSSSCISCSVCTLQYHIPCIGPHFSNDLFRNDVTNLWMCPFCVMNIDLYPKSPIRQTAAKSVRLMARMRKRYIKQQPNKLLPSHQTQNQNNQQIDPNQQQQQASSSSLASNNNNNINPNSKEEQEEELLVDEVSVKREDENYDDDHKDINNDQVRDGEIDETGKSAASIDAEKKDETDRKREGGIKQDDEINDQSAQEHEGTNNNNNNNSNTAFATPIKKENDSSNAEEGRKAGDGEDGAISAGVSATSSTKKRKNLELAKLGISMVESLLLDGNNSTDNILSSSRKNRIKKKPSLYDPQVCPASSWRSDVVLDWKSNSNHSSDKDGGPVQNELENKNDVINKIPDSKISGSCSSKKKNVASVDNHATIQTDTTAKPLSMSEGKAVRAATGITGMNDNIITTSSTPMPTLCTFCQDDPNIVICCFCACRICYGKHNQSKLLICDNCDEEYHTFCLKPPLSAIPTSAQWFCPSCTTTTNNSAIPTSTTTPNIRVSGRASTSSYSSVPGTTAKSDVSSTSPTRVSGRKIASLSGSLQDKKKKNTEENNKKAPFRSRKPETMGTGKNKKREASSASPERKKAPKSSGIVGVDPWQPVPRKRGRPFKNPPPFANMVQQQQSSKTATPASPKKSASPPKSNNDYYSNESKPAPGLPIPVHVSRSGRKVKRINFHDDIDEGEQHLRVIRNSSSTTLDTETINATTTTTMQKDTAWKPSNPIKRKNSFAESESSSQEGMSLSSFYEEGGTEENYVSFSNHAASTNASGTLSAAVNAAVPSASHSINHMPMDIDFHLAMSGTEYFDGQALLAEVESGALSIDTRSHDLQTQVDFPVQTKTIGPFGRSSVPTTAAAMSQEKEQAKSNNTASSQNKLPRRKPGARECMQISRRFGVHAIPQKYMDILMDYCSRGKVEHLIRMRERLDDHSRFLESQLAGLEALVKQNGESDVVVPIASQIPGYMAATDDDISPEKETPDGDD